MLKLFHLTFLCFQIACLNLFILQIYLFAVRFIAIAIECLDNEFDSENVNDKQMTVSLSKYNLIFKNR